ncbi:MAG TPA: type II toxin-antitoxin system VapC family toxin [Acidimicrobiia bacterium]|nr:type II toxin-antitoxin system VapC family toxin [Acidimicrobiia bacterium]
MLVADASVIAPVVADGGPDGGRFRQRLAGEQIAAPDLLHVEVLSVIRRQLHIGTVDATQADQAVADLLDLPMTVYPTAPLLPRCWQLRDNLTAYDACYIALAEILDCSLLTADTRLSRAPGIRCPVEVV